MNLLSPKSVSLMSGMFAGGRGSPSANMFRVKRISAKIGNKKQTESIFLVVAKKKL